MGKYVGQLGYCTFHKCYLFFRGVRNNNCLYKGENREICGNFILIRNPFWQTSYGQRLLSRARLSSKLRYKHDRSDQNDLK